MDKNSSGHLVSSWLVPLVFSFVLAFVIAMVFTEFNSATGPEIRVTFQSGHGLQPNDDIKCRGITVGTVRSLELDGDGVLAVLQLHPEASSRIARAQSRWWVARPKVGLSRVQGIDSLLGPRWVQVDPAPDETDPCFEFTGLDEPPIVESIGSGDLRLSLLAPDRGTLHQGSSVLYRGVSIGTVLDARLADDSTSVVADVLIQAPFAALVRDNSRFYETGAFDLDIGFDGINARLDSLETLIVGGVSLVTPDAPGEVVESGHRFEVLKQPESDWLDWRPKILLDS